MYSGFFEYVYKVGTPQTKEAEMDIIDTYHRREPQQSEDPLKGDDVISSEKETNIKTKYQICEFWTQPQKRPIIGTTACAEI